MIFGEICQRTLQREDAYLVLLAFGY